MIQRSTEKWRELFASCPTAKGEYTADGKKYTVTRHFTGKKEIRDAILEIAQKQASRESNIP